MAPILFHDAANCASRAAILVARELGIELSCGDLKDCQDQELALTCDVILVDTESNKYITKLREILKYLVDRSKIGHTAYPDDIETQAKIQEMLDLDEKFLKPPLNNVLHAVLVSNRIELSNSLIVSLQDSYNCLERQLQNSAYLTGDSLTVADLCCLATVSTATVFTPICSARHPKLSQWFSTCKKLPYYKEANSAGLAKLDLLVEEVLGQRI